MRQIRPSHLQQWVKAMSQPAVTGRKSGLAPSTIRTRYNYAHMAFRAAVVDRVIKADPSAGVPLPRARKASAAMTIPAVEEVGRALSVAPDWFRPFIAVCAFAGLRLGEAAGLRLEDVDFLRRTISVRHQLQGETNATTQLVPPKFGSERVVYAPAELVALLAGHVRRVGVQQADWLFSSAGLPLNRNSAGHQWRQVRRAAGLDGYTLHDLRHFYASGLIASGCDVVTVQRALGHSSATITLGVYSHLWPTVEDRTRAAAGHLMAAALETRPDFLQTEAL
jgi:integrase